MKIITIIAVLLACIVLCYKLFGPFIKAELYVLKTMYDIGLGNDDGVQHVVVNNKGRYKNTILDMLHKSKSDTFNAEGSFLFAGMLADDSEIHEAVVDMSENHPDRSIRCFWHDVVNNRYERHQMSLGGDIGGSVSEIIDKGSTGP